MKVLKKIIAVNLALVTLFCLFSVPAYADGEGKTYTGTSFSSWLGGKNSPDWWNQFIGYISADYCEDSPTHKHTASSYLRRTNAVEHVGSLGLYDYECRCQYCGDLFYVSESNVAEYFQTQYDAYVEEELPVSTIDKDGHLIWSIPLKTIEYYLNQYRSGGAYKSFPDSSISGITVGTPLYSSLSYVKQESNLIFKAFCFVSDFSFPVDAYVASDLYSCSVDGYVVVKAKRFEIHSSVSSSYFTPLKLYNSGYTYSYCRFELSVIDDIPIDYLYPARDGLYNLNPDAFSLNFSYSWNVVLTPLSGLIDTQHDETYSPSSRATTFTGDIGIMGDNGQLTKVDGDQIFNETTNNYYNPYTDTSTTVTDWNYDYSDRSYHLTTEAGDTVTVTYGDENITIEDGGETYNVYYVTVNESTSGGGGTGGDTTHTHTWGQPTASTPPTCTTPGSNTYTCSGCGETKTETVPATGHTWTMKQSVPTKYDENGELLQAGYTIYECSVCGEQYKSIDGTGPPGGGSSSGSGGSEDGESIWDKLGKLFGTLGSGLLDLIGSFIGKLLDALISLAELIAEKLTAVVDVVLKIFDAVPGLFTGFLGFLSAAFPFIPEEIMLLLTFGIAAVVFIGIIKAIRR